MTPAEIGKHLLNLVGLAFSLESQHQETQASRPAFETSLQRLELLLRERERHRLVQEGGHFLWRKAQIGGTNLLKVATGTPASQRQRGFGAGRYDQVQRGGKMIDQVGQ